MTLLYDHENYNCEATLSDGNTVKVYANYLHNADLDYWKGWSCNAGLTRISILANGDVYDGVCQNRYLGNLKTGWDMLKYNVCTRDRCVGCTEDLMVDKRSPDVV